MKAVYLVKTIEGNIVQCRFTERKFAEQWLLENNFDEDGNCLNLYKIERTTKCTA